MQDLNQNYLISQVEQRNCRNSSIYIPTSRLHLHSLFLPYWTHSQHPELSRHHVTHTKHSLSFEHTLDNLHNFVHPRWAFFHFIQLYHNANGLVLNLFATRSDGTKGQLQREGEGHCKGKNTDIGYTSTLVGGSGQCIGIHLRTHPWTYMDIQCLQRQRWECMNPRLWYILSWSSCDSPGLHNSSWYSHTAGAGVRVFRSGGQPSARKWGKCLIRPALKWRIGGGTTPMPVGINSIAQICRHPARWGLHPPACISLGTVVMISGEILSRQTAGRKSEATFCLLDNWIGMR